MDLNIIWFFLVGILFIGYAILDGFDLGVGMLQIFSKNETEKQTLLEAIAPFWDGNEVWLITGGGALFAAFPHAYSTVFSGFYIAMMLVLVGLILRALSIEFRNQVESAAWKNLWDKVFTISSFLVALLLGVALGNIFVGIPLDAEMNFTGSFFTLLRPVPLIVGITGLMLLVLQGATYLQLKSEGVLNKKANGQAKLALKLFIGMFVVLTISVYFLHKDHFLTLLNRPAGYLALLLVIISIVMTHINLKNNNPLLSFVSSSLIILSMFFIIAATVFPNIVPAINPHYHLTIYSAASSQKTLGIMLIIALIGMPFVLLYTGIIYRIFRFKKK
jgi:cytochrome bd ubiquinol oxidase subunit II